MSKRLQIWLTAIVLMSALPASAEIWVKDFNGQPEQYKLLRNGKNFGIQYYLVLKKGDQIWVDKGQKLNLESDDGQIIVIKSSNSPYLVQDEGKAPGVLTNLVSWAGEWFNAKVEDGTAQPVVSLVTRAEITPIVLSLASAQPVKLMADTRPLHFVWEGGDPPYRVQLLSRDNKMVVLNQDGIKEPRYDSPSVFLNPGAYQLKINDQGRNVEVNLEVVANQDLPKPPSELSTEKNDSARETLYSLWLAAQGKQWVLEAYQRAVLWQNQYPPAKWLMYSLEKGARPDSLPQ
jgi:hypothetical protein